MIGTMVSRYRILERLGAGGMGVIYKAEDTSLGRKVALKFLPETISEDHEALRRFKREARAASALNHPNICTIHDIGEHQGRPFIVMELLEGEPLNALIGGKPLPNDAIFAIADQVADALQLAHSMGVVHRDIKPSNIFVAPGGQTKILDFGLAKLARPQQPDGGGVRTLEAPITDAGRIPGTVSHMSPEQALGQELDSRTDLFSFGVVLYEMATGVLPFREPTWTATANAIINRNPPSVLEMNPNAPPLLASIIEKALMKDRNMRYQTAGDLKTDISRAKSDTDAGFVPSSPKPGLTERRPRVGVLPFVDSSAQKDQEYFCDGIAEELIDRLSQLSGIRIASRTSTFSLKGKDLDARGVCARLGVDHVLEGSVRKAGNHLRINVQLVAADGYQIWSERFDREMEDIFTIQDQIARAIESQLKLKLGGPDSTHIVRRYTDNVEAYNAYLKGLYYWNRRFEGGMGKALECFEQAIQMDPSYTLAHAGIADCYVQLAGYSLLPPAIAYAKALSSAEKALQLDENLAEAQTAMAMVNLWFKFDHRGAEFGLRRALELNPRFGLARHYLSLCLAYTGRFKEAIEEIRYAQKLEPLSIVVNGTAGLVLYYARQYDLALEECRKTLEMEPSAHLAIFVQAAVYAAKQMWPEAIASFEHASKLTQDRAFWFSLAAYAYGGSGDRQRAEQMIETLRQRADSGKEYVDPILLAWIYSGLSDADRAFEWFERAYEAGSSELMLMKVLPALDPVRSDPRMDRLVQRVGL
jgi:serine/threonine-protein kinase